MDDRRFDALTKKLGRLTSRRTVAAGLALPILGLAMRGRTAEGDDRDAGSLFGVSPQPPRADVLGRCDVCASGCDHPTIASALADSTCRELMLQPGATYREHGLVIDRQVWINAYVPRNRPIIDAERRGRVFEVRKGARLWLQGAMELRNGLAEDAGCILNDGMLSILSGDPHSNSGNLVELNACEASSGYGGAIGNSGVLNFRAIITDCQARFGGAIASSGRLAVYDSRISGCAAEQGAGIFVGDGTADIYRSRIADCSAFDGGGVYSTKGATSIGPGTTIENCTAYRGGGVAAELSGTLDVIDSTIANCRAEDGPTAGGIGGGVAALDGAVVTLEGETSVVDCTAPTGGGVHVGPGGRLQLAGKARIKRNTGTVRATGQGVSNLGGTVACAAKPKVCGNPPGRRYPADATNCENVDDVNCAGVCASGAC